jgi:hypothetical protein
MASPSTDTLVKFVTEHLALSVEELFELRGALDAHLCKRVGAIAHERPRRTLYLPQDSLREL